MTFQFTFCSGLEDDAQARGWITFDQNLMSNPFSGEFDIEDPMILDVGVVITNSEGGYCNR